MLRAAGNAFAREQSPGYHLRRSNRGAVAMASAEEKLKAYADEVEKGLETRIQGALNGMPLMDRRVLAIRGYLRFPTMGRGTIEANWAWSNDDMEEFKKTSEFTKMKEAVAEVKATFAAA